MSTNRELAGVESSAEEPGSRYSIRPGYRVNPEALSVDDDAQTRYWTPSRIEAAKRDLYQFGVYRYAVEILRRYGLQSIIDVGCGTGTKLGYVHEQSPGTRIVGVDQLSAIQYCRAAHPFGEWHADDLENPDPALTVRADLVVSADVIEHLRDPDRLLAYVKDKVRPGGWVIISTPDRDRLRGRACSHSPNPFHVREWSFDELREYLASRGFTVVEHFHQFPVKLGVNKLVFQEVVRRYLRGRSGKYNQVCLLQVR